MPVGSKWQLFIPADLAYGDRGAGADIGPGSTLIFEIELLSIKDKSEGKTPRKRRGEKISSQLLARGRRLSARSFGRSPVATLKQSRFESLTALWGGSSVASVWPYKN